MAKLKLACAAVVAGLIFYLGATAQVHAGPTALFDQGHGQRFLADREGGLDLSGLAGLFREAGYEVRTASAPLTADLLAGSGVLILSGAFLPYSDAEIEGIISFLERGGALCVMLHIAPPYAPLLNRLGVAVSRGVIQERQNVIGGEPRSFSVTGSEHPLFSAVGSFSIYGGWALLGEHDGVRAIARTSPSAWIDLNRSGRPDDGDITDSFAVAMAGTSGRGRFVVFGDDAIFQNRFLSGGNQLLGRRLAEWLRGTGG